ncbi:ATP synthase epsilon chain [Planctomycetales bacterium 10988]|nr:ATP synthase epsilon chain [Planctomycetales bacterium 10988]
MAKLHCVVVTPEMTVLEEDLDFLVLPLYDGEIGLAPLHGPMIGRLGYGEMRIKQGETTTRYYVDGGFVQLVDDQVSVLTNHAIPAEKLDDEDAKSQLNAALAREAHSIEELEIRDRLESQARAKIKVAERYAESQKRF